MAIFLSYCEEDAEFVHRIFLILSRMHLNPYAFMLYREPGEFIPEVVVRQISTSNYFVPFLTQSGVQSQWVNQEIGVAHALRKYIIPIAELGVESKGFVEFREHIKHDPFNPEQTIFELIWRLRTLLNPASIDVKCPQCGHDFVSELPSLELTAEAIGSGQIFATDCPSCGLSLSMNPRTQELML